MTILIARGAYGRAASPGDWQDGKNFQIVGGPYFSIRDCAKLYQMGYLVIWFCVRGERVFSHDLIPNELEIPL